VTVQYNDFGNPLLDSTTNGTAVYGSSQDSTNDKIDLDSKSRGLGLDLDWFMSGDQITMLRDQIVITKKI
jgi:hypothetical protein